VSSKPIGIMGGTFDPPHIGHLIVAQEVAAVLSLEQVLFVPAGVQPLKQGEPVTPPPHRVRMVELAIADNPCFVLSRADVDRPGASYTVDLLGVLQRELGPEAALHFIVGADSLRDLAAWRSPGRILELARLVAVPRPGHAFERPGGTGLPAAVLEERILMVRAPSVDVSATEVRERVREGRPIRYLVPEAVERYIREQGLYRAG
jgi:nicotinate-nucleotide adenylyltransferase